MSSEIQITFGVRKIKTVAFFIEEKLYRSGEDDKLNHIFQHAIDINVEKELIIFTLRCFYSYSDLGDDFKLIDLHVATTFYIKNLESYLIKKENGLADFTITENVWATIVGLSVSHLRAMLSINVAGTIYQDFIIPIIPDALEFTRRLMNIKPATEEQKQNIIEKAST